MTFNRFLFAFLAVLLCETGCEDKKQGKDTVVENTKDQKSKTVTKAEKAPKTEALQADAASKKVDQSKPSSDLKVEEINPKTEETADSNTAAATFSDGSTIPQAEILKRIKLLPEKVQGLPFSQLYNLVLFVMIQEKLAYSFATKEGLDKQDDVAKQLKNLQDSIMQQYYLEEEGKKAITEDAIKEQYQDLIKDFKPEDEIGLRHILVKTEEEAGKILGKLAKNESFEELQKIHSIDRKTLAKQGFLGFFRKSQLPKDSTEAIIKTPVGQVVKKAIEVPKTGYSILMVTDIRQSKPAELEKVRDRIKNILVKKASLEKIEKLYQENKVVLFNPDGKERPYKTVNARLADLKNKQKQTEPSQEEIKLENSVNQLKNTSIVARIGDKTQISFEQISNFIKEKPTLFQGMSQYETYTSATEEYINKILLAKEVQKNGIANIPEVKQKSEEASHSFLSQKYLTTAANKMITNERLQKSYDELIARFDKNEKEYSIRVIPVKSMDDGKNALDSLKKGKSFDSVMDTFCSDQRLKDHKGMMGYLTKDQLIRMSSELYDAVVKAPKATYVPKPIDVNGQMLVIRVEDKRQIELPKFQDVKHILKRRLVPECMIKVTLKMIESDAVKAYDFNGNPIDLSEKELEKTLGGARGIA